MSDPDAIASLPLSPGYWHTVERSASIAHGMGSMYLDSGHLLLSIIEGDGVGYRILQNIGITRERIREEYDALLGRTE